MACKYLIIKLNKKYGCKLIKKKNNIIDLSQCINCKQFKQKEYKKVNYTNKDKCLRTSLKTPLKRVSKKREFVSKETYDKVFIRDKGSCIICGTIKDLHLHHINGRGKNKTDNPDNCCMLCNHCHLDIVHKNNKYWRTKLNKLIETNKYFFEVS